MKKRKRLYVSGPMTGVKDNNVPAFNAAAKALRHKGYLVINPLELDKKNPKRTWEECLRRDIAELVICDDIATLPRWKKSKGALLEVYVGRALSMPVHSVPYYLKGKHK